MPRNKTLIGIRGPRGVPASAGMDMGRVVALERQTAKGKATATINTILGGTATVTVTIAPEMPEDYVAFASLNSVSAALLAGVVTVAEVRPIDSTHVTVVLRSTSVLSSQSVTVCVGAIG